MASFNSRSARMIAFAFSLTLAMLGCSRSSEVHRSATPPPNNANPAYPQAAWRLNTDGELARTVLWVSHIVIMHAEVTPQLTMLRPAEWAPDKVPSRSRAEALELARRIAAEAQASPSSFASLARKYSDDVTTRAESGSLGGACATQLPASYLDALSRMEYGSVSEVVESRLGYSILLKRFPPPKEQVSGTRLVVRYSTTIGETPSTRTREEAQLLAKRILEKATGGADFDQLVLQYSDAKDRARGGRLGVWDTTNPCPNSAIVETLAHMKLGEVSAPVDTAQGLQILKRTAIPPPFEFAARAVVIDQSSLADGNGAERASNIRNDIATNQAMFATYQKKYCCSAPERWLDGHGDPVVTAALEKLAIGEIAPSPIKVVGSYLILQRLDPELIAAPAAPRFELPTSEWVDVEGIVADSSSNQLFSAVTLLLSDLSNLRMSNEDSGVLRRRLEEFRTSLQSANTSESRLALYNECLKKLALDLSEPGYARALVAIHHWAAVLMRRSRTE